MDYANDYNTPFLQRAGAKKRLGLALGGGLLLLILIFTVVSATFSTDGEEAALDSAARSMYVTKGIADLAGSYSQDNFIKHSAASLGAIAVTQAQQVSTIKAEVYGSGYAVVAPNLAEQDAALAEAARAGNQEELAADFMAQAVQASINDLVAIEAQLPNSYAEQLQEMRADLALYLEELAPNTGS